MTENSKLYRSGLFALTAAAVLLGWNIVQQPLIARAPPSIATRVAPMSATVLRRAAESEFTAKRPENAAALARLALAKAPFDARALRVVGLTEADAGRTAEAEQILTLAGNWSLRDDPAHAWLMEYRLRRGDYASALAHADTLVRRRADITANVFALFTTAAAQDRRALPALVARLDARPPWRQAYLDTLTHSAGEPGYALLVQLAIALKTRSAPLTHDELEGIYLPWVGAGRIPAVQFIRQQLAAPAALPTLENGSFSAKQAPRPFDWDVGFGAGYLAEIAPVGDEPGSGALRVEYAGKTTGDIARQLLTLPPGSYQLMGVVRGEPGMPLPSVGWRITCLESGTPIGEARIPARSASPRGRFETLAVVPSQRCTAQWLTLAARPQDEGPAGVAWFDDLQIKRLP